METWFQEHSRCLKNIVEVLFLKLVEAEFDVGTELGRQLIFACEDEPQGNGVDVQQARQLFLGHPQAQQFLSDSFHRHAVNLKYFYLAVKLKVKCAFEHKIFLFGVG